MNPAGDPPNNLAAEAAVLGAVMFDNRAYERVRDVLREGDFYAPAHQAVWRSCASLIEVGQVADGVTLRERFERDDQLTAIGGASYLADILASAAFGAEITDYAKLIRDLSIRRRLIDAGQEVCAKATTPEPGTTAGELVGMAVDSMSAVRDDAVTEHQWQNAGTETASVLQDLYGRLHGPNANGQALGLRTGLDGLDRRLSGLHAGDLIIIAGRPAMGKTSLAMNVVKGVLETHKDARAAMFSLEMGREATAYRNATREAHRRGVAAIEYRDLRAGTVSEPNMRALMEAQRNAASINDRFLIDVSPGLTIRQVETRARQARRALGGLDLLCIDYLQLIRGDRAYHGNRVAEVADISMRLKQMAKELDCPVIALAQLNRGPETRPDHRPMLADLKESGSIEQDADAVVFCYRPEYYLERSEPKGEAATKGADGDTVWDRWNAELIAAKGQLHAIVDKNRHGPAGSETLYVNLGTDLIVNSRGEMPDIGGFI